MRTLLDGALLVLSAAQLPPEAPIVTAGIGAARLREAARRLGRETIAFETLLDVAPAARERTAQCAPAAAVAVLAGG
jgi:(4-(4-[2-(gamma-L-glutamylamino)ethyl]phenoxymethyl)furan-2-yl)methanamine synthase